MTGQARNRPQARFFAGAVIALAVVASCRTARPAGTEAVLAPLTPGPGDAVIRQLTDRMTALHAVRTLMHIRVSTGERTQSFRAQLLVEPQRGRMQLTAYTPIGTEAVTLSADGDRIVFADHIHRTAWQGSTADLARAIGFFDPQTPPAAWALDIAGFPARGQFETSDRGLARGTVGDVQISFDPPSFPPRSVTVRRGNETLEITHLEIVSTDADVPSSSVPDGYRCCVEPKM